MFTGLISAQGTVLQIAKTRLHIQTPNHWLKHTAIGDSIAVDGACLTATTITHNRFTADISPTTAATCAAWQPHAAVNLEHPLAIGDKLGGHFVTGHVDGIATLVAAAPTADGGKRLRFVPPPELMKFIVNKGSITLGGVSLTIADARQHDFIVQIVPHTLAKTTLGQLQIGNHINIESDLLARHVEQLLTHTTTP